ncbi:MAG: hypothetical protein Q4F84_07055 [Fibrobacter sp.]|nr:hypothetical protein [Fibrobacter sp.]
MKLSLFIKRHVLILFFVCFLITNSFAQNKLYVYYPTVSNSEIVKNTLVKQIQGPTIEVFAKHDEFVGKVSLDQPDAIIAKSVLISTQLTNYEILLNGQRGEKAETKYVILSTNKPLAIQSVNSSTVLGVVNFLGRNGTDQFEKQFFTEQPRLKRVSKPNDLLPLLSLNVAAGILIEDFFVDYFESTSQLEFFVTPAQSVPGTVGFAVKKGATSDKTIELLKQTNKEICDIFHIDMWK